MLVLLLVIAVIGICATLLLAGPGADCKHVWTAANCETPKTCSKCGETSGSAAGHRWIDATCTTAQTCSVCGEQSGKAAGHQWIDATCTTVQTCSVCGEESGEAPGHQWTAANCTAAQTCSVCGEKNGEAAGHKWTAATCTAAQTCSVCGEKNGEAAGHKWNAATCTTAQTCSVCGDKSGSPLGHQWVDATYSSPKTCSICNAKEGKPKDNEVADIIRNRLPLATHAMGSVERSYGYEDAELTQQSDYYINASKDQLVIVDVSEDGSALKIKFPSSSAKNGYRTLWFAFDDIVSIDEVSVSSGKTKKKTNTYRYSSADDSLILYGAMEKGSVYDILGDHESGCSVIIYLIYDKVINGVAVGDKLALVKLRS